MQSSAKEEKKKLSKLTNPKSLVLVTYNVVQRGEQHNGLCIVIPDHLPEILYRVRHWMLGDNEVAQSTETVQPRGIDIITAILPRLGGQMDATALDGKDGATILDRVDLLHGRGNVYVFCLELYDILVLLLQVGCAVLELLDLFGRQIGLARGNGFDEGIMQENVLLLRLHKEVSLCPDVTQEAKDIDNRFLLNLLEHGV